MQFILFKSKTMAMGKCDLSKKIFFVAVTITVKITVNT